MKYKNTCKQALALFVAISFGGLWAMDDLDAHRTTAHAALYSAYQTNNQADAISALQTTLAGHAAFTFLDDANPVRNLETGYYMRMAMLGLERANLNTLVTDHRDFFQTSLGASLLYMWMAKQSELFYVAEFSGPKYTFARVFERMANGASDDGALRQLLKDTCSDAVANVQAEPFTFYGQILYYPFELERIRERESAFVPASAAIALVLPLPLATSGDAGPASPPRETKGLQGVLTPHGAYGSFASPATNYTLVQDRDTDGSSLRAVPRHVSVENSLNYGKKGAEGGSQSDETQSLLSHTPTREVRSWWRCCFCCC